MAGLADVMAGAFQGGKPGPSGQDEQSALHPAQISNPRPGADLLADAFMSERERRQRRAIERRMRNGQQ